jgi:hypothetical protein
MANIIPRRRRCCTGKAPFGRVFCICDERPSGDVFPDNDRSARRGASFQDVVDGIRLWRRVIVGSARWLAFHGTLF